MKRRSLLLVFLVLDLSAVAQADLSLSEALRRTEDASPELRAAADRERGAHAALLVARSYYYPSADAEAIDSFGFAGSNSALGIDGLMGSPFRKGPAAGVSSKLALFDPARFYGVKEAKARMHAAEAETQIIRFQLDEAALRTYLEAARDRSEHDAWSQVDEEIHRVAREVNHLVQTGQHAEVENALIEDQVDEAAMTREVLAERYETALRQLSFITLLDEKTLACPPVESLRESDLHVIQAGTESPLITAAAYQLEAAQREVSRRRSGYSPRITAMASVGTMDEAQLVEKKNYSGGFGLDFPLFEGFRVAGEVQRARASAEERNDDLAAARLEVDQLNARYDDFIAASRIRLGYLARQQKAARLALDESLHRYLAFLGPLVEVREALRNLSHAETQLSESQSELLLALGSKLLLNGGRLQR